MSLLLHKTTIAIKLLFNYDSFYFRPCVWFELSKCLLLFHYSVLLLLFSLSTLSQSMIIKPKVVRHILKLKEWSWHTICRLNTRLSLYFYSKHISIMFHCNRTKHLRFWDIATGASLELFLMAHDFPYIAGVPNQFFIYTKKFLLMYFIAYNIRKMSSWIISYSVVYHHNPYVPEHTGYFLCFINLHVSWYE